MNQRDRDQRKKKKYQSSSSEEDPNFQDFDDAPLSPVGGDYSASDFDQQNQQNSQDSSFYNSRRKKAEKNDFMRNDGLGVREDSDFEEFNPNDRNQSFSDNDSYQQDRRGQDDSDGDDENEILQNLQQRLMNNQNSEQDDDHVEIQSDDDLGNLRKFIETEEKKLPNRSPSPDPKQPPKQQLVFKTNKRDSSVNDKSEIRDTTPTKLLVVKKLDSKEVQKRKKNLMMTLKKSQEFPNADIKENPYNEIPAQSRYSQIQEGQQKQRELTVDRERKSFLGKKSFQKLHAFESKKKQEELEFNQNLENSFSIEKDIMDENQAQQGKKIEKKEKIVLRGKRQKLKEYPIDFEKANEFENPESNDSEKVQQKEERPIRSKRDTKLKQDDLFKNLVTPEPEEDLMSIEDQPDGISKNKGKQQQARKTGTYGDDIKEWMNEQKKKASKNEEKFNLDLNDSDDSFSNRNQQPKRDSLKTNQLENQQKQEKGKKTLQDYNPQEMKRRLNKEKLNDLIDLEEDQEQNKEKEKTGKREDSNELFREKQKSHASEKRIQKPMLEGSNDHSQEKEKRSDLNSLEEAPKAQAKKSAFGLREKKEENEDQKGQNDLEKQDELLTFQEDPKKPKKKPKLYERRNPKETVEEQEKPVEEAFNFEGKKKEVRVKTGPIQDDLQDLGESQSATLKVQTTQDQDDLMTFDLDAEKTGKKPTMSDRMKKEIDEHPKEIITDKFTMIQEAPLESGLQNVIEQKKEATEEPKPSDQEQLMTFEVAPNNAGKKPNLRDKRKPKEEVVEELAQQESLNQDDLMNFDTGSKKVGKKPVLTDKKNPKETEEALNEEVEELMNFDAGPKKKAKMPILTDKRKPKEPEEAPKEEGGGEELMTFDAGPKKTGKMPILTDKRKPKEPEEAPKEQGGGEELMTFDAGPKKTGKMPVLTDKRKPKEPEEAPKEQGGGEELMTFDAGPKKTGKMPILTDKRKPKEPEEAPKEEGGGEELMTFDAGPKKTGKMPILTDKRKPKEPEEAPKEQGGGEELMTFDAGPKKTGKMPVLTDKRKPKEPEEAPKEQGGGEELMTFDAGPKKTGKMPILTDKRKPKEPEEAPKEQGGGEELMTFDAGPKKTGKMPVLTDKRKPKEPEEALNQDGGEELMNFDAGPKKTGKRPVLTDKKKPKEPEEALNLEGGEELMNFDAGPKKVGKKPVLTKKKKDDEAEQTQLKEQKPDEKKPEVKIAKEVPLEQKDEKNGDPNEENAPEPPKKGYNLDDQEGAFPPGAFPPGGLPEGVNAEELQSDITLDQKIKSNKLEEKLAGLKEMQQWKDPHLTKENFLGGIHLTIKEKDSKAINLILEALEGLFQDKEIEGLFEKINVSKFLESYAEKCIVQAKGPVKKRVIEFIAKFYAACKKNNSDYQAAFKPLFKSIKPKIQENTLLILAELVKAGNLLDFEMLTDYWEIIAKATQSRTKAIATNAIQIYKEFYYYLPEELEPHLEKLKKEQKDELKAFFATIDPKDMKQLVAPGGKEGEEPVDIFEMQKEQDMPGEYGETTWTDQVAEQTAWKEKERMMLEFCKELKPIRKLNAKTKVYMFVDLFKKMFAQPMVMLKIDICKIFELLADRLRKNMRQEARQTLSIMLKDLKIKNKQLKDQIFKTVEKFFHCMTLDDMLDDIKENLGGKNVEKEAHILDLIILLIKKSKLIETYKHAVKIANLVKSSVDSADAKVRDNASKALALLLDQYTDQIKNVLGDLNTVKMNKILKNCTNPELKVQQEAAEESPDQGGQKADEANQGRNRAAPTDKSSKIRNMRENLFSNNQVKISDTGAFSKFLEQNLKTLSDMTKEFKELNANQSIEIFELIDEIAQKVSKQAFVQFSREQITKFYIEMLVSNKHSDETYQSIQSYLNSKNNIVSTRIFLKDVFDVVSDKNINVTRELMNVIVRLMEEKLAKKGSVQSIAHKHWVEFLKAHFTNTTMHISIKTSVVNMMRTIQKKFGERILKDYPNSIYKDFETQNKEIEKQFSKLLDKLTGSVDKREMALAELSRIEEVTKLTMYWSNKQFLLYLKQALRTEKSQNQFKSLTKILSNFVDLYNTSRNDFSHKNYLQVFEVIISKYYDQDRKNNNDLDEIQQQNIISNLQIKAAVEEIFNKTVAVISPSTLLNNMILDQNSMHWVPQILSFYLQYGQEIEVNTKFIDFIVQIIKNKKTNDSEIKTLVDNTLLMLKTTDNDQIIIKGDEVKVIREIWQKKEEDVLFELRFLKGFKIFEDIAFFNSAKTFIESQLKFEGTSFHSKDLSQFTLSNEDPQLKIKLAYFYLRSVENITFLAFKIFEEISQLDLDNLPADLLLISLKILFNILKNNYSAFEEMFYQEVKNLFLVIFQIYGEDEEELSKTLDMTRQERDFLICVLSNAEGVEMNNTSQINSPRRRANDISQYTPVQKGMMDVSQNGFNTRTANNKPSVNKQPISPRSRLSQNSYKRPFQTKSVLEYQNREDLELQNVVEKMWSFVVEEFEAATIFFSEKLSNEQGIQFIIRNFPLIVDTFSNIISKIFEEGINFGLERESYQLIFSPLEGFCMNEAIINSLDQEKTNDFVYQLLLRLVTANQEKIALSNGEVSDDDENIPLPEKIELANFIMKSFNSLMLKVIKQIHPDNLLQALFAIIIQCCQSDIDDITLGLYNLCFKCLMKFNKDFKKSPTVFDPRIIFRLVFNFMDTHQRNPNLPKNNYQTIEGLLKQICQKMDLNDVFACYQQVFGQNRVPYILNVIEHYQKKGHASLVDPQILKKQLIQKIKAINSSNNFNNLPYQTQEIMEILGQDPNMRFEQFAEYFKDKNFYQYIQSQINLQMQGGIHSQYQSHSRLNTLEDQSQWDQSRIEGNSMYKYQR